jgi:hypothetical protein
LALPQAHALVAELAVLRREAALMVRTGAR